MLVVPLEKNYNDKVNYFKLLGSILIQKQPYIFKIIFIKNLENVSYSKIFLRQYKSDKLQNLLYL